MPLVFVNRQYLLSSSLRLGLLFGICISLWLLNYQKALKALVNLTLLGKLGFGGLVVGLIVSTIYSVAPAQTLFLGFPKEYQGLIAWALYLLIGVHFIGYKMNEKIEDINRHLVNAIIVLSVYVNFSYLSFAFRLEGLLTQATVMGMYACIGVLLNSLWIARVKKLGIFPILFLFVSLAAVLLSQSRVALYVAATILIVVAGLFFNRAFVRCTLIIGTLLAFVVVPPLVPTYFNRLNGDNVEKGAIYRLDLYNLATQNIEKKYLLSGLGASTLPKGINDKEQVPEQILKTLDQGFVFISAHDIFFDILFYFGGFALFGFIALLFNTVKRIYTALRKQEELALMGIFCIAVINGIVNTPSLEFTSLLFVTVFALQTQKSTLTKIMQRPIKPKLKSTGESNYVDKNTFEALNIFMISKIKRKTDENLKN